VTFKFNIKFLKSWNTVTGPFEYLKLRIFSSEFELKPKNQLNVFFEARNEEITIEEIKEITNYFVDYFGKDSIGSEYWKDSEAGNIKVWWHERIYNGVLVAI